MIGEQCSPFLMSIVYLISFEALPGLYGTSMINFDVLDETLFLNSGKALYVKQSVQDEWERIEFPNNDAYFLTQLGEDGEQIISTTVYEAMESSIRTEHLVEGTYLIKIESEGKIYSKKIIRL